MTRAPSGRRIASYVVDVVLLAVLSFALFAACGLDPFPQDLSLGDTLLRWALSAPVSALVLAVPCWRTEGRTPGKLLLGLRAVRLGGEPVTLGWALWREVGAKYIATVPGLIPVAGGLLGLADPLWAFTNEERRTLHDLLARSRVVRT